MVMNNISQAGQEVFVGGGGSWKTVASTEVRWSGVEFDSDRGHYCCQISLILGWGDTHSYVFICPSALEGRKIWRWRRQKGETGENCEDRIKDKINLMPFMLICT